MPSLIVALLFALFGTVAFLTLRRRQPLAPAAAIAAASIVLCAAATVADTGFVWQRTGTLAAELRVTTVVLTLALVLLIAIFPAALEPPEAVDAARYEPEATGAAEPDGEPGYRGLADALSQMVWIVDRDFNVRYVNNRWLNFTGLAFEPGSPSNISALVHPSDAETLAQAHAAQRARQPHEREVRLRRRDGTYVWHLWRAAPLDSTPAADWVMTATDIDAHKAAEAALATIAAELAVRADHDPLTHLPNRAKLISRLGQMMESAQEYAMSVAVLYVDVDDFTAINETLGHEIGDAVLLELGSRISASVRSDDIASRFGGDEFVVACFADTTADTVRIVARIQAELRKPIEAGRSPLIVASSIGISLYPRDGSDPGTLIRNANTALHAAKARERDSSCFYEMHMERRAPRRVATEAPLS